MIESFRQRELRDFYLHDRRSKSIPANIVDRLFRRLQLIDDASSQADLRSSPGNRFELMPLPVRVDWREYLKGHEIAGRLEDSGCKLDDRY
jgi:hypothetical protein